MYSTLGAYLYMQIMQFEPLIMEDINIFGSLYFTMGI